jgi:hypothetical protein
MGPLQGFVVICEILFKDTHVSRVHLNDFYRSLALLFYAYTGVNVRGVRSHAAFNLRFPAINTATSRIITVFIPENRDSSGGLWEESSSRSGIQIGPARILQYCALSHDAKIAHQVDRFALFCTVEKGVGLYVRKPDGVAAHTVVSEYIGVVLPAHRWFHRTNRARAMYSAQLNDECIVNAGEYRSSKNKKKKNRRNYRHFHYVLRFVSSITGVESGSIARFTNHSSDEDIVNSKFVVYKFLDGLDHVVQVTTRHIAQFEEVVVDYGEGWGL